jgi:hypothetical protein
MAEPFYLGFIWSDKKLVIRKAMPFPLVWLNLSTWVWFGVMSRLVLIKKAPFYFSWYDWTFVPGFGLV